MKLAVAADHAGIALKQRVAEDLKASGHEVTDLGSNTPDPLDDYPDYAEKAAHAVLRGEVERAILICGSGAAARAKAVSRIKRYFASLMALPC